MRHVYQFFAHDLLRFDHICGDAGDRSFVADRPGQNDIDLVAHARMHDAAREDFLFNGGRDTPRFAHNIDCAQMVFMTAFA